MDQEEQRHMCRLCSKSFLCGRSLGGHMRSHMSSSSSTSFVEEHSKLSNGYRGLRESPKKTRRLSSSVSHSEKKKQCRECGKEFQSWRALFGHMRCHSSSHSHDKIREEEEEEEGSWSGHGGGEGLVRVPRKKRRPRRSAAIAGPSSSTTEDHEQEDVAISLMMLSRDAGYWGSDNPATAIESSDKNSAILEEDNRDLDDFKKPKSYHVEVDELYAENESDDEGPRKGSGAERKRRRSDGYGAELGKSRYECATCKKSFHSYQALGGHRASHKRLKGRCCGGGGSSFDTDTWVDRIVVDSAKASAGNHRCGVCGKVFASGQALGGHKRSHLVTSSPTIVIEEDCEEEEEEEAVVVMHDLLDLNLPAPVDEDSSNQRGTAAAVAVDVEFNSWWRGSNLKNEAMVGMIAN